MPLTIIEILHRDHLLPNELCLQILTMCERRWDVKLDSLVSLHELAEHTLPEHGTDFSEMTVFTLSDIIRSPTFQVCFDIYFEMIPGSSEDFAEHFIEESTLRRVFSLDYFPSTKVRCAALLAQYFRE